MNDKPDFLTPLSPRVRGEVNERSNGFMRAFSLISPIIIYMLYVSLLTELFSRGLDRFVSGSEEHARYIADNGATVNAFIRMAAILIATAAQIPALLGEKIVLVPKADGNVGRSTYIIRACYGCLTGISLALFLNTLFSLTGFSTLSENFSQISAKQLSLPLTVGSLLYGIIVPLGEEVVFRGLVYNRMRRYGGAILSIVMSSIFFGVYHMNLIQGVYSFLMGLVVVWIYERYGGLIYPILVHASANLFVYLFFRSGLSTQKMMTPMLIITGVITIVLMLRISKEKFKS